LHARRHDPDARSRRMPAGGARSGGVEALSTTASRQWPGAPDRGDRAKAGGCPPGETGSGGVEAVASVARCAGTTRGALRGGIAPAARCAGSTRGALHAGCQVHWIEGIGGSREQASEGARGLGTGVRGSSGFGARQLVGGRRHGQESWAGSSYAVCLAEGNRVGRGSLARQKR
jgi:hypothetical protein